MTGPQGKGRMPKTKGRGGDERTESGRLDRGRPGSMSLKMQKRMRMRMRMRMPMREADAGKMGIHAFRGVEEIVHGAMELMGVGQDEAEEERKKARKEAKKQNG